MSQDDGPRRPPSCSESHFHSDAALTGNNHLSDTQQHKALENHGVVDGETSVEGQQAQSNENDDTSTTTTSSPIQQQVDHQGEGEGERGDDMADSDDVNMEDDGSLEVSTVPVAEEVDEEWWDLKMQWGGKVYDIRVGGNDM